MSREPIVDAFGDHIDYKAEVQFANADMAEGGAVGVVTDYSRHGHRVHVEWDAPEGAWKPGDDWYSPTDLAVIHRAGHQPGQAELVPGETRLQPVDSRFWGDVGVFIDFDPEEPDDSYVILQFDNGEEASMDLADLMLEMPR